MRPRENGGGGHVPRQALVSLYRSLALGWSLNEYSNKMSEKKKMGAMKDDYLKRHAIITR